MRRIIPSFLLFLLLLFLIPIYVVAPTGEVAGLAVLLLGLGLFLGFGNQPHGLSILMVLSAVVALIGTFFLGQRVANETGAYCAVVLLLVAVTTVGAVLWRRATVVERGQILVVNQLPENRVLIFNEGVHRPLTPSFERKIAVLPGYELVQEQEIRLLNTESMFNVDRIDVLMRYRVQSPRDVVFNLPNRETSLEALQRERGTPETHGEMVALWTDVISRQICQEVEEEARGVVASVVGPVDVFRQRNALADRVKGRLQSSVKRWGIELLDLRFLEVLVDPARVMAANRDKSIEREKQDAERNATMHAYEIEKVGNAQAKVTAQMVLEMVRALREEAPEIHPEDIERIVTTAMQRTTDTQQLSGFFRQLAQAPGNPSSASSPAAQPPKK